MWLSSARAELVQVVEHLCAVVAFMVRSRRPGERFGDGADAAGELLAVRGQGACPVGARGQEGDAGDVLELADLLHPTEGAARESSLSFGMKDFLASWDAECRFGGGHFVAGVRAGQRPAPDDKRE